jgi:hypothetical protein
VQYLLLKVVDQWDYSILLRKEYNIVGLINQAPVFKTALKHLRVMKGKKIEYQLPEW